MSAVYLLFGLIYAVIIALSIVVVVIFFYITPRSAYRTVRRCWGRSVLFLCGIRVKIDGEFDPSAQMIVMNHASILDIVALEGLHPADLCWLAKKEISNLPVFGQIIKKPRMISIDRSNARAFLRDIKTAQQRVEEGRVLAIFPEGTRGDGIKLLRFKKGAQMLHDRLKLRIQPVVFAGTRRAIHSKGALQVRPFSKIIIKPLECCESLEGLEARMQSELDALNAQLGIKASKQ